MAKPPRLTTRIALGWARRTARRFPPRALEPLPQDTRARILVVNTELLPDPNDWPRSYRDLVDPKWKGRCAIAKPANGTTLTHFAAMQKVLGNDAFSQWLDGMFANDVQFLQGNGATLRAVRDGKLPWAFTDTDDYHVARTKGHPVGCVFPDQGEGQIGTMLIPNSVAIVKDAKHPDAARKLVDWLLSEQTEAFLAAAKSAQIPLRAGVKPPGDASILPYGAFRSMAWDPVGTAEVLESTATALGKVF
jgi:iron(III) transport system substrate-binding protein